MSRGRAARPAASSKAPAEMRVSPQAKRHAEKLDLIRGQLALVAEHRYPTQTWEIRTERRTRNGKQRWTAINAEQWIKVHGNFNVRTDQVKITGAISR